MQQATTTPNTLITTGIVHQYHVNYGGRCTGCGARWVPGVLATSVFMRPAAGQPWQRTALLCTTCAAGL